MLLRRKYKSFKEDFSLGTISSWLFFGCHPSGQQHSFYCKSRVFSLLMAQDQLFVVTGATSCTCPEMSSSCRQGPSIQQDPLSLCRNAVSCHHLPKAWKRKVDKSNTRLPLRGCSHSHRTHKHCFPSSNGSASCLTLHSEPFPVSPGANMGYAEYKSRWEKTNSPSTFSTCSCVLKGRPNPTWSFGRQAEEQTGYEF